MLGNTLLTFYRVTTRHPLYAALTLLGLGASRGAVVGMLAWNAAGTEPGRALRQE